MNILGRKTYKNKNVFFGLEIIFRQKDGTQNHYGLLAEMYGSGAIRTAGMAPE